jgi:hypothetical protein
MVQRGAGAVIRLSRATGCTRVVALCDRCGEEITNGRMAIYQWHPEDTEPDAAGFFEVLHKGRCAGPRPDGTLWCEMDLLPVYLAANMGVDLEAAMERAALLGSL